MASGTRDRLVTTEEAAAMLGTEASTLVTWRCTKAVKVPYVKIGRSVRYRMHDLGEFIEQNTVRT
mgnify:CR=1